MADLDAFDPTPSGRFTADQLDGVPIPPRVWHVRDLIPGRQVTLLSGDGGVGKSTLALQLACATVAGLPWLGQEPRAGRALYLSAEDERDELHRRLDQIAVHYKVGLERFAGLMLWPLVVDDPLLATGAPGQALQPTPRWHELGEVVADWRPSLIVFDANADHYGGNENERAQVRQWVGMLRGLAIRADAAVLPLSHPSVAGISSGSGMSGSTAWNNSVRSRLYLEAPKADDGGNAAPDIRTLTVKKANYGPSGVEYRLRYSVGAFVNEDLGAMAGLDKQVAADRIEQQFLDLLDAFTAQGRHVSHNPGHSYAPTKFAQDPAAKGTTAKGFAAAMSRHFAANRIRVGTTGPQSRQVKFIERVPED